MPRSRLKPAAFRSPPATAATAPLNTNTLDLSILFFIAILIGGRGSILGPLLGTILLTVLPEFAAPLVAWSTFLYAVLLLVIVLAIPGGIADMLDFKNRRPLQSNRAIVPQPDLLTAVLNAKSAHDPII